jgi:hypothetical protein
MRRHLLDPVGTLAVPAVVRRLCGVQTQVASSAELAIRVRRRTSRPGEVARALSQGRLIKTWAMRGALHVLTPEEAGVFLSLMAAGRSWERPSWQRAFGATPEVMQRLRDAVRDALDGEAITREELVAAIVQRRGLAHVGDALRSGWGTLLKPLAWQGDLCFGPARGNRVTFVRPETVSASWRGVPDPDEAAPTAIASYLGTYAPATFESFGTWLAGGYFGKRQLRTWFDRLSDRLARVEVEGEPAFVLAEDLDALAATEPTAALRLLPGFDQYVLGPTTSDGHVTPPSRRGAVSKQSGWISPVVVAGGVVRGTWQLDGDHVRVTWFGGSRRPSRRVLGEEVDRLASILGRDLETSVDVA